MQGISILAGCSRTAYGSGARGTAHTAAGHAAAGQPQPHVTGAHTAVAHGPLYVAAHIAIVVVVAW